METEDPFVRIVDKSFDKIKDLVYLHNLRRIQHMERKLEDLERDLTGLIDSCGENRGTVDPP